MWFKDISIICAGGHYINLVLFVTTGGWLYHSTGHIGLLNFDRGSFEELFQ